jgi:hypothetical protein
MSNCEHCKKKATAGINLSNGGILHQECNEHLLSKETSVRNEIKVKEEKLQGLQNERRRRERLAFKIISFFSKPKAKNPTIESAILQTKNELKNLSIRLRNIQAFAEKIYELLPFYPPDWEERRLAVYLRDGEECKECGRNTRIHIHHVTPLSKGGTNKIGNLITLCEDCHSKKHNHQFFTEKNSGIDSELSRKISLIRLTIEHERKLTFLYRKGGTQDYKQRNITPKFFKNAPHVKNHGSTLCIVGYCEYRKEDRVFALKRMKQLKTF